MRFSGVKKSGSADPSGLERWGPHTKRKSKHAKEFCLLVERNAKKRQENANLQHKAAGLRAPVFSENELWSISGEFPLVE